ncbi:CpsD/CapB family tyrosine-protein kinase [Brevibacillus ruminantium]|uniref:non-specific protein-tyrosine kinase n=1 Tax=Brevibacillus ruminantium TaxID=2950604 RepID=A0ABY4WP16_9BACL|nr:CpsD/CapB family tyrosine-protein kinase [Brevibacillus ruminantium]USG67129.1 CpsD/CapB family tyrosine-protein kinase [Brevibacillus ruminantium]
MDGKQEKKGEETMRAGDRGMSLVCLEEPRSPIAEAYRTLRTNLQFAGFEQDLKSLLITSADPGEGKTTTVTNLAVVMAQTGKRVLVIDADLRRPALHFRFPVTNLRGLSEVLSGERPFAEVIQRVDQENIHVMTSGTLPPNPSELLHTGQMRELLLSVRTHYDVILLDAPPILPVTDAQILARHADGVLLVVRSGKVLVNHVKKAQGLLQHAGANLVGTLLNHKRMTTKSYYYD